MGVSFYIVYPLDALNHVTTPTFLFSDFRPLDSLDSIRRLQLNEGHRKLSIDSDVRETYDLLSYAFNRELDGQQAFDTNQYFEFMKVYNRISKK